MKPVENLRGVGEGNLDLLAGSEDDLMPCSATDTEFHGGDMARVDGGGVAHGLRAPFFWGAVPKEMEPVASISSTTLRVPMRTRSDLLSFTLFAAATALRIRDGSAFAANMMCALCDIVDSGARYLLNFVEKN
jgi:hypothetical protein